MKKTMAFMLVAAMLVSMFTIGAFAVDNYQPKEIILEVNEEGNACNLPEGTVVYLGDTVVIPSDDIVYFGDLKVKDTGEIETDLVATAGTVKIYRDDALIGSVWGGPLIFSEEGNNPECNWFMEGEGLTKPGKYRIDIYEWHDAAWKIYLNKEADHQLITFDVVDPKTVDEIVVPGGSTPATSSEAPVESSEAPVESTEAPVESTEAPVESTEAPTESKAPTTESKAPATSSEADADTEPAKNGWITWVIIGVVAVVVIAVIIVIAKKKKKA